MPAGRAYADPFKSAGRYRSWAHLQWLFLRSGRFATPGSFPRFALAGVVRRYPHCGALG